MWGHSFFETASRLFHQRSSLSKILVVVTVSGGGLATFHETKPVHTVYADSAQEAETSRKKKVVVLGTGWAGVSFLKNLRSSSYDIEVVSPKNYFMFTPLLPSVTCGTVEARSIVEPIRKITEKGIEDAVRIRQTVIDCFERASLPSASEEEKKKLLSFVCVGGGPAGVEFAAELHDFVKDDLAKLYPSVTGYVKITVIEASDHILNMFDKRITAFAEGKFFRDGIDVKTGSLVVKLTDKEVSAKDRDTGKISNIPYGMVLWATGIGPRPEIVDFMKQIGQTNRRVLATDEWLRVEGCDGVYALGDCATVNQRRVVDDIVSIFRKADKDNSGTLSLEEFQEVMEDLMVRYPQLSLHLKSKHMRNIDELLENSWKNPKDEIDIETFKAALSQADSQMKNLPATAQVAAQQGAYLADCFNRMEECEKYPEGPLKFRDVGRHRFQPFRYKHFGMFAPLGGEQTAAHLPGDWVSIGQSTQWLWYSVYASKLVSWRTRVLVVSDWGRRSIFGRDTSRI
ncbi:hypothetical protein C1H46_022075 [Malus baccata]|uniref:NADH:ubiquinone reductase (non-electrogenic) n=1 Tax=Malus baccata TaxID=106549 RepID=A0A540M0U9_MALBA|nr:hypothetical protein C1H46_022075 [Malus baccata]